MTCSFSVLSVTSVSVTGSRRRPRESWACPAARTLRAQSESGSADTRYRPPLTVSGETGAERGVEALVVQSVTDAAVVAGHGQGSARLLGVRGRRSAVPR